MSTVVGIMHPGEMGAAIGACLVAAGHTVLWASEGRSRATTRRAEEAGLRDVSTSAELAARSDVLISVCPPHAALDVARSLEDFDGIYVDANAISPATTRMIAASIAERGAAFVDGGIIGPPPRAARMTRLYLSGEGSDPARALFDGTDVEAIVVSDGVGDASALKMAYAAWTKGTSALLLAIRAFARAEGVEGALLDEWARSQRNLADRSLRAEHAAATKGWRWVGEMEEIASAFASRDLPDGFHLAAARIYERSPS